MFSVAPITRDTSALVGPCSLPLPWNFGGGPVSISRLISVFVAMMIFLIASTDNPFRRESSVPPDAFARFRLQPTLFT
jgi:hypothetical protein